MRKHGNLAQFGELDSGDQWLERLKPPAEPTLTKRLQAVLTSMKICTQGFEFIAPEELMEEALTKLQRFKPEPNFSKTGGGSMLPASTEERAKQNGVRLSVIAWNR